MMTPAPAERLGRPDGHAAKVPHNTGKEGMMPKGTAEDGGQSKFSDRDLNVPPDVIEAIETFLEHKDAAKECAKAKRRIKEAIPEVEEATRFAINGRYFASVTVHDADAHTVAGGRQQRTRITEQ